MSPVGFSAAGALLESRPELLDALCPILGIRQLKFFRPGVPYERQREEAAGPGDSFALRAYPDNRPAAAESDDDEDDADG
jgi:hypothetical protein